MKKAKATIIVISIIVIAILTGIISLLWSPISSLLNSFWAQAVMPNRELISFITFSAGSIVWLSLKKWSIWIKLVIFALMMSLAGNLSGLEVSGITEQGKYQFVILAFLVISAFIKFRGDYSETDKKLSDRDSFCGVVNLKSSASLSVNTVIQHDSDYIQRGTVIIIPKKVSVSKSNGTTTITFASPQYDCVGTWSAKCIADGNIALSSGRLGIISISKDAALSISSVSGERARVSIKF